MEIRFAVKYHYLVVKNDIPKLPLLWRNKIKTATEERLTTLPELYGKPLRYSLKNYRKLRVGDYRVIFRIEKRLVKILVIQHRSLAYKTAGKRVYEL